MKEKIRKRRHSGFTLVEVLVAMAILSLVVPPILSSFVTIAKVNRNSRRKLDATTIANGFMESVQMFGLDEVAKETTYPSAGFLLIPGYSGACKQVLAGGETAAVQKVGEEYAFTARADGTYTFFYPGVNCDGNTFDVTLTYRLNANKTAADVSVLQADGSTMTQTTSEIFGTVGVRVLRYYDVEIKVEGGGSVSAHLTGTKADYN